MTRRQAPSRRALCDLPFHRSAVRSLVPYEVTDGEGRLLGTVDLPEGTDLAVVHCVARRYWHPDFAVHPPGTRTLNGPGAAPSRRSMQPAQVFLAAAESTFAALSN
jgi:hypothetical protein